MEEYSQGVPEEDLEFTKNALVKSYALDFETIGSLLRMLNTMSTYDLPADYIKQEEEIIRNMTLEEHKALAQQYINPDKMFYLIVGDAATQMEPLKEIGYGDPVLLKY
jgi:zinc protease